VPFVRAADLVTHYAVDGPPGAPVVMLANSLGTSFHMWDAQVPELARAHRVLRYDMRGHGLTDTTPPHGGGADTIARLANDAVALLDALAIGRVHFVGLSIGGMVGQRLAAEYPERVVSLVLCATGSRIGTAAGWNERIGTVERDGLAAIAGAGMKRWFTERAHAERPELVRGFANMLTRTPVDGYAGGCAAVRDADLRADDARIRCRTLIVVGDEDPTTTPAMGAEMRDAIPGAELLVLDAASHLFCAEQPGATNAALLRFLEGGK
jgi:3-oxoadipate enol-lactonase